MKEQILEYVSYAETDIHNNELSIRQAVEKIYWLCKMNKIKVTRKTIKSLINNPEEKKFFKWRNDEV